MDHGQMMLWHRKKKRSDRNRITDHDAPLIVPNKHVHAAIRYSPTSNGWIYVDLSALTGIDGDITTELTDRIEQRIADARTPTDLIGVVLNNDVSLAMHFRVPADEDDTATMLDAHLKLARATMEELPIASLLDRVLVG